MKFKFHRRDIAGFEAPHVIENDRKYTLSYNKKQSAGTFFGCEPVIAERGLSGASDFMGFTVEWWHSQATYAAMPGKLWFPRNRGTNITENAHFRKEKERRGYPLRLGTFSTFGSWRPSGFCSPYKCLHGPQVGYTGKTLVSRKF